MLNGKDTHTTCLGISNHCAVARDRAVLPIPGVLLIKSIPHHTAMEGPGGTGGRARVSVREWGHWEATALVRCSEPRRYQPQDTYLHFVISSALRRGTTVFRVGLSMITLNLSA